MRTIKEKIETKVSSEVVWKAWERMNQQTHQFSDSSKKNSLPFTLCDIREGHSFTTVWKSAFVRLVFSYEVEPQLEGSIITCEVYLRGFFAYPIRLMLKKKLKKMITNYLHKFVQNLEDSSFATPS